MRTGIVARELHLAGHLAYDLIRNNLGQDRKLPERNWLTYDTTARDDLYQHRRGRRPAAGPDITDGADRLPVARHQSHVAPGRSTADASAHGARLDPVLQG